jgi:outer membrane biogenesis lipoprotein LolB
MEVPMTRLRLELDQETYNALLSQAKAERRLAAQEAEVLLRQALGLPFPVPRESTDRSPQSLPALTGGAQRG